MAGSQVSVNGRWARWLLLACTMIGLTAMHTLGHTGGHADGHAGHQPPGIAEAHMPAAVSAADAGCAECAHPGGPVAPERGGMGVWSVCLAVLAGLTAAVALLLLLVRRPPPVGGLRRARAGPALLRGPPPRYAGLTLAAISVLRI